MQMKEERERSSNAAEAMTAQRAKTYRGDRVRNSFIQFILKTLTV